MARAAPRRPRLEDSLATIRILRTAEDPVLTAALPALLADDSNIVVGRAADLARERGMAGVIPDLLAAWDRLLVHPVQRAPRCVGKFAVLVALKELGHADPDVFLAATRYVQLEPDIPAPSDKAPPVRGAGALALVGCEMDPFDALIRLTDLLTDPSPQVRGDAARAIGGMGQQAGILPLRLTVERGDREATVIGDCLGALLALDPAGHLDFVAERLRGSLWIEASIALSASREERAVTILLAFYERAVEATRLSLVALLGTSPVLAASEHLLTVLEGAEPKLAGAALEALARGRFRARLDERIRAAVARRPGLAELAREVL